VLNVVTPQGIETSLVDEQTDTVAFDGDVFAFSTTTQFAAKVYGYADRLRSAGKKVILGHMHVTVCPDEAARHADAIVTGEAETIWPQVCQDLLAGRLQERYAGSPTPPSQMAAVDYRFFGARRYRVPASIFATRGCNHACAFCVGSRYMGPFRTKPLDVLEREMDQIIELYPRDPLQFSDDNLLADREYGAEVLNLLRRKGKQFVAQLTVDQLCDRALLEELAASGCQGVGVGVESVDHDNCAAVQKYHNLDQPLGDAVRQANALGVHVVAMFIVGLPHDSPERLARTKDYLASIPFLHCDFAILRVYPSTSLYAEMLPRGDVVESWWLGREPLVTNLELPGYLRVYFRHPNFAPLELQHWAVKLAYELSAVDSAVAARILRTGRRARNVPLAMRALAGRKWISAQSRKWLPLVERAMADERAGRLCWVNPS
jgi:radical SAM superfamily enzyme YgiQ (UPF0313 family)